MEDDPRKREAYGIQLIITSVQSRLDYPDWWDWAKHSGKYEY